MKDGIVYLKDRVKSAPDNPGVYRMLNAKGDVLYVGKAKNLKKRLTSYTREQGLSDRIRKMVFETRELVLVETETEAEALLLEISLIKSLKPKYNVLFRDDTSYPYILLSGHDSPRLMHHRGAKRAKGHYFGPYPDVRAMHKTIAVLEKAFQLRTCKDTDFANRSRPCLKYHIKRCSAPCVGKVTKAEYDLQVKDAVKFLKGSQTAVQDDIKVRMLKASEEMRFEDAAKERDKLQALASIVAQNSLQDTSFDDADCLAISLQSGWACVQVYMYRAGKHVGNTHYTQQVGADVDAVEVLHQFVAQHYSAAHLPKEIICETAPQDIQLLETALSDKRKVAITVPERGNRRKILQQVLMNAERTLERQLAERQSWSSQLDTFAEVLGYDDEIHRIETFDISNISGKFPVASLVVAGREGMLKSEYRKFNIKSKDTPDDYTMMREVLTRRYARLLDTDQNADDIPMPDVVMVDGGKGHLRVLVEVMDSLDFGGVQRPVLCAIAKGEERDKGLETIFQEGVTTPLDVPYNSPLKFVLQVIRDESHRFAIGFHRQKRSAGTIKSGLDDVPGIGAKRKKALLLHFGSLDGVKNASASDLLRVDGISQELAQSIVDYFKG